MEKEKKTSGLYVVVGVLLVLVLLLGGYIVYDKLLSTNNNQGAETDNTNSDTNSNQIDTALLNNLYDVLGIGWEASILEENEIYNDGNCLNYFLSNNNYKDNANTYGSNAQRIFALYAGHIGADTTRINNDSRCDDKCERQLFCADCRSVLKEKADKIIKLYGLEDYKLTELSGIDTDYAYVTGTPIGTCHYLVKHNLNGKYIDNNTIVISDNQVVTDFSYYETEKINSTKNQDVTYTFKKDNDGNYYLSSVNVK